MILLLKLHNSGLETAPSFLRAIRFSYRVLPQDNCGKYIRAAKQRGKKTYAPSETQIKSIGGFKKAQETIGAHILLNYKTKGEFF